MRAEDRRCRPTASFGFGSSRQDRDLRHQNRRDDLRDSGFLQPFRMDPKPLGRFTGWEGMAAHTDHAVRVWDLMTGKPRLDFLRGAY